LLHPHALGTARARLAIVARAAAVASATAIFGSLLILLGSLRRPVLRLDLVLSVLIRALLLRPAQLNESQYCDQCNDRLAAVPPRHDELLAFRRAIDAD
jgi:hypothetical protein